MDQMLIKLQNYFNESLLGKGEGVASYILSSLKKSDKGYAGYAEKEYLEQRLQREIANFNKEDVVSINFDLENSIKDAFQKCNKALTPLEDMEVYIFPTADDFVLKEMNGFSGFTPYEGVIHVYIHIQAGAVNKGKQYLKATFVHEYVHAIRSKYISYDGKSNILNSLIHEGLAENFVEKICGSKYTLSKLFPEKELESYMERIAPVLDSVERKDYRDIFYGGEQFQQWTGYTIGYYLVKKYLERIALSDWNEIIKLPAEEFILEN